MCSLDYLGNSNDSFCSSDISLDGSNFDNLDEATSDTLSLQNLDLHASHIHNNLLEGNAAASNANIGNVNPIDKLYLMQNSYFNSEQWNFDSTTSSGTRRRKQTEYEAMLWFQLHRIIYTHLNDRLWLFPILLFFHSKWKTHPDAFEAIYFEAKRMDGSRSFFSIQFFSKISWQFDSIENRTMNVHLNPTNLAKYASIVLVHFSLSEWHTNGVLYLFTFCLVCIF